MDFNIGKVLGQTKSLKDIEPGDYTEFLSPVDITPKLPAVQEESEEEEEVSLQTLLRLSLKKFHTILKNTPLIPHDEEYIPNAKLVLAAAQAVTSTQLKVDENQLKQRKQDDLMTILEELRAEGKKPRPIEVLLEE